MEKGARVQAIGRSRGGPGTKIHAAVARDGRPRRLIVGPGQGGDAPMALALLGDDAPEMCVADMACDSNAIRAALLARGTAPTSPNNPGRGRPHPFDAEAYRLRNAIERTFCRLKDFRRVATRYDKLAVTFHAAVAIVAIVTCWI